MIGDAAHHRQAMHAQLIGQLAAVIALISVMPYVVTIFRGRTKPSRAAYAIWLLVDLVTTVSYVAAGARATSWLFWAFTLTTVIIFLLSIKYGMGGLGRLDICCVAIAMLAITLWVVTDDPILALYTILAAKLLGYAPIITKAYRQPETENQLSWAMAAAASCLNLFALTSFRPEIALVPIATAATDVVIAALLIGAEVQRRRSRGQTIHRGWGHEG
jgi:hypothetical protein